MIRALTCFALLALAACQGVVDAEPRLSENQQDGISLALSASPAQISPGDTVRLTARLTNHTGVPVRLEFSSGCQIFFSVENAKGQVVEPEGGSRVCTMMITHLELAPGETKTRVHPWAPRVPAGSYRAYATLQGTLGGKPISLRTAPEPVELR